MSGGAEDPRARRADRLVAAGLVVVVVLVLQLASRGLGFPRDEVIYFNASEHHAAYYGEVMGELARGRVRALWDRALIDRFLGFNHEHPALMKTLSGLSWRALHRCSCPAEAGLHPLPYPQKHRTLGLLVGSQAMRLPAHVLWGLLIGAVYLFGSRWLAGSRGLDGSRGRDGSRGPGAASAQGLGRWRGPLGGMLAAGLLFLMPRTFFHAQLHCFDAPVAAMIFLITWAYLRAQETGSRRWAGVSGVLLGLGLLTKHNTYFLPPVLLVHSLWIRRGMLKWTKDAPFGERLRVSLRYLMAPWAVAMATLGPVVFLLGWPWLWPEPLRRFGEYVAFHLHHVHYNIEYLGTNYNLPPHPWHYVPVMTALTVPVTTLGLFLVGIVSFVRSRQADPLRVRALVVMGLLWPLLVIMRPGTPIFGAEKHWMPAMPFLSLLAAAGFLWALERAKQAAGWSRASMPRLGAALGAFLLLAPALEVRRSLPYGLSHYNVLAGGPAGAATLGMNRQFWGYAARWTWPFLNGRPTSGAAVYFHDASLQIPVCQREGQLRRDVFDAGLEEPGVRNSDVAMVVLEKHFNKYEYWIWDAYGTTRPSYVLSHEGVPLVPVYERPASAPSTPSTEPPGGQGP